MRQTPVGRIALLSSAASACNITTPSQTKEDWSQVEPCSEWCTLIVQALLLARLEANASGDKQLAQALVIPKNLEDEALRSACQAQHGTCLPLVACCRLQHLLRLSRCLHMGLSGLHCLWFDPVTCCICEPGHIRLRCPHGRRKD